MLSILKKLFKKKELAVLPRVKNKDFIAAIKQLPGFDHSDMPIIEPLIGDLILTYAIDIGDTYRMLSLKEMNENGLAANDMRAMAFGNGMMELSKMEVATDGTLYQVMVDNGMSASSILYPDFWNQVMDEIGGPVMAIFPHRDSVFYGKSGDATRLALAEILKEYDPDDTHSLTKSIFIRDNKSPDLEMDFNASWPHYIRGWKISG